MTDDPFNPAWGDTTAVTNAVTATTAVVLPKSCRQVLLTNTSSTARVHVYVTTYFNESSPPTGVAPTTATGLPIQPDGQIRVTAGPGLKVIRTIATAADGEIIITPGNGD